MSTSAASCLTRPGATGSVAAPRRSPCRVSAQESRQTAAPREGSGSASSPRAHAHVVDPVFLQILTAPVFSLRWLRTESRQSPIRFKQVAVYCDRPGGFCRPRETLVPSRVQGVSHIPVAVALATPVRNGLTAWAIQSSALHRVAPRRRPIIRWVLLQTGVWLTAFGQAITRNSAAHRRASARAAWDSPPARACARSP